MRVGLVRNVGLSITALAVLGLGACDSNPVNFDVKNTVGVDANPTDMVIPAGRTGLLESRAVNQGGEPTYDAVSATIDATCGQGAITVEADPDAVDLVPPGQFIVTGGLVLGQTCITLASGGATTNVDVTVVTDAIEITAPDAGTVYRAGATDQVVAQLIDLDGNVVGPYAPEDAVFSSDNTAAVSFTDDMGNFTTETAGAATLQVTWAGQDLNGTAGIGVVRTDDIAVEVIANVPASAALAAADFGAIAGGTDTELEVIVSDEFGNQNTDETEITACVISSDAPAVATATCELRTGSVNVFAVVSALTPGTANISGTVTTSEGPFTFGPAPVTVLAPVVTSIGPVAGLVGEAMTIVGTGLVAAGFDTEVLLDGAVLDPIFLINVTDTQIDFFMPDIGNTDDVVEVAASVGGVVAETTEQYIQLADRAEDEPLNDSELTGTPITFPLDIVGSFEAEDVDDHYMWTSSGATLNIDLDWDDHSVDLDILVIDIPFTGYWCFDGATGAAPEVSACDVPSGETVSLWINNFSGPDHPTSYRLMAAE